MNSNIFILALLLSIYISTGNVESFDLKTYRLPTWAVPDHYYLNIDLRNPEADTFSGYTLININVTEKNHKELVLNVNPLFIDVDTATITVDGAAVSGDNVEYSKETQIMVLSLSDDLYDNLTKSTQFQMNYTAKFSETVEGLFKHTFTINGTEKSIIFTQFEEIEFRRVFPSFDEPCFKAPITLSVDHYENLTVASNMPEVSDSNDFNNSTTFQDTPLMSSYLLAVVAGSSNDWQHILIPGTNQFRLFIQKIFEDYISITKANAPKLLENMGEWTGIPYESLGNPKMTFAGLPGMGGAMENWGLIIFTEGHLVDEGNRTTSKAIHNALTTMAHEISHQWFGDFVTLNWWSETWLNEGFASYFEWYLADTLSTEDNDYGFDDFFVAAELQYALLGDGPSASPLSNNDSNVNTPDEIASSFSVISYNKGACILRMLKCALGEEVFQKGVREYLKAKALGNAKAEDLIQHLQEALPNTTDVDLPTYMESWIHQPSYPIVKTSLADTDAGYFLMSLDIYKYSPTLNETRNPEESIWWVPISYITSDNPDPADATYFWINPGRTFGLYFPTDDYSWGVVNADASGYYRVDYDLQSLSRILSVLNNPYNYTQIAVLNRAQILDDIFNIAKYYTIKSEGYNDRPYINAFTVAEYLKYETEYVPWVTFLKEVQYLLDEIKDDLTENKLKDDVLALIEAQLVIPDPNNASSTQFPHTEVLKRNLLLEWACRLNQNDAIAYVKSQFPRFLQDTKSIDNDFRDVIICYGIRNSDDPKKDYSTLLNIYANTILPFENYEIATAMACMADSDLLKSYLESTLTANPPIAKQYWAGIFKAMHAQSPEGLDAALHFMVNHIDEITQKWKGLMSIESMFSTIAKKIVKPEHIKMLQSLLPGNSLAPALVKAIEGAIKTAEHNVDWSDKFGTELTSVLVYGGGDVPTTTTNEVPTHFTTTEVPTTTDGRGVNLINNMFSSFVTLLIPFLYKYFF